MWRIEFSFDRFLPHLPEKSRQNPGVYGFELAQWVSLRSAKRGAATAYPIGSPAANRAPYPPKVEYAFWHQYCFATENGVAGYTKSLHDFTKP